VCSNAHESRQSGLMISRVQPMCPPSLLGGVREEHQSTWPFARLRSSARRYRIGAQDISSSWATRLLLGDILVSRPAWEVSGAAGDSARGRAAALCSPRANVLLGQWRHVLRPWPLWPKPWGLGPEPSDLPLCRGHRRSFAWAVGGEGFVVFPRSPAEVRGSSEARRPDLQRGLQAS
jgi:hypothetical protein